MQKAVCLVSGGMDSCVSAAIAHSMKQELYFLHVSYGQLTQDREWRAFNQLAEHFQTSSRLRASIEHLRVIGGSALTDKDIALPPGRVNREGIPSSYVPFRNANLLSIATSWAEVLGGAHIYIGAVEEDSSGYPDCRKAFFEAFEKMIRTGTKPDTRIEIHTPLINMSKKEIVEKGVELRAPLELTWSCYQSESVACRSCDSCLLRLKGFREAGLDDPIPYAG